MLQTLRERSQAWAARVIILLLIIPFALWGIQEYAGRDAAVSVASVNGTDISQREFQRAYEQEQQRLRGLLGKAYDQRRLDETRIKRAVVDRLVEDVLIAQVTTGTGLYVSNAKLAEQLHSMPELLDNGIFSKELYDQRLRSIGLTPAGFEERLRQALLSDQLSSGVAESAVVTQHELDSAIRLREQQREIGYMILPLARFTAGADPDATAVSAYYQEHRTQFTLPEQVSIEYIELAAADLAQNITPTEQDLRTFHEEQAANYRVEERRRASQILIAPDKSDEAAVSAAKARAEALVQRLRKGEAFARLAADFSQDAATAKQGGDLGWLDRGVLNKAVEDALFALQPGAVSEPVQAVDGFHILMLNEVQPAHSKGFEEVRGELERDYRKRTAEQQYFEKAEILTNLTYEHPDTLAVAAQQLGLSIKTSVLFARAGGESILAQPKIISAAFGDEVLVRGFNSEPLEIDERRSVVLRIKEHKPATVQSLDEARPAIMEQLRKDAARVRAQAVGKAVQARLLKGEPPEVLAREHDVEWFAPRQIRRDEGKINQTVVRTGFQLPRPAPGSGQASVGGVVLESGDYAVIALSAVHDGNPAALDTATRLQLQRELQRAYAAADYQGYLNGLKQSATIAVHPDNL